MMTEIENLINEADAALKIVKRYDELNARFEKYASPDEVTNYVTYCVKHLKDFPDIGKSYNGISLKQLLTFDGRELCKRLDQLEQETPGEYAALLAHLLHIYKNIQAYYNIKSSYLADWLTRHMTPLLLGTLDHTDKR